MDCLFPFPSAFCVQKMFRYTVLQYIFFLKPISLSNIYFCRYRKGKEVSQGKLTLNDPYSVFQNVANTPGYHKKGKMEMIARLDNFGPFHVFFTVSCADYKWAENLISVLRENGCSISCIVESDQTETYFVQNQEGDWIPLDEYMDRGG